MIFLLLLFLFISSFVLFITSRHDFVLLRQNISIRQIFDRALVIMLVSLIFSRAFYLIDERQFDVFLNPLRFLHIGIFWGFNYFSIFVGALVGVFIFFRKRKNALKILDIYTLSFYPLLIFEFVSYLLLNSYNLLVILPHLVLVIILFGLFIKIYTGFGIKDGVVSFLILILASALYLSMSFFKSGALLLYSPIQIVAGMVIALSIYFLVLIKLDYFNEK